MSQYFVHEKGFCESQTIGEGTRIWAFAHILPGAKIGEHCNVCDQVFIENDVVIGDRVTIKCGVQLWDGLRVGNDVFIGPNATFTNDRFPRSRIYPAEFLKTTIENGVSIGANATILPGVTVGRNAMIGAGSVVTSDVPPNAIVYGNPARLHGYRSAVPGSRPGDRLIPIRTGGKIKESLSLGVGGCMLLPLSFCHDLPGDWAAVEFDRDLPFTPRRQLFVRHVSEHKVRDGYAHRICRQFLIAVSGAVNVVLNDGRQAAEVCLDSPSHGLLLEPLVWSAQYKFSPDAVLVVYASHPYDTADYIHGFDEFMLAACT